MNQIFILVITMITILMKSFNKTLAIVLLLLTIFTFSGCENSFSYESLFYSIFEISAGNDETSIYGTGTGFKYTDGELITNFHIVGKQKDGVNTTYSYIKGKIYGCDDYILFNVSSFSYEDDYAVLIPSPEYIDAFAQIKTLDIGDSDKIRIGERCFTIGNLFSCGLSMNEGVFSSGLKRMEYKGKENTFIQTSIEIAKGSSGGPLFDSNHRVVGMCAFKLRDTNMEYVDGISFFIPLNRIINQQ